MGNPWLLHVAEFRKSHPTMIYKDILKAAKTTYTKVPKKTRGKGIIQDIGEDIKKNKTLSKAADYLNDKVKQAGYGKKKK